MANSADRRRRRCTSRGCGIGALCAMLMMGGTCPARAASQAPAGQPSPTNASAGVSPDAQRLARWIIGHADAGGQAFLIVDKMRAAVFAFDQNGALVAAAPALLGLAHGDDTSDAIGALRIAAITPTERITPAGRFAAGFGQDLAGKDMLWLDYDAGIALHAVVTSKPAEHRLQRLATPSVSDNRISYGCINVPAAFFETVVRPLLHNVGGIVYVLPETRSLDAMFFAPRAQPPKTVPLALPFDTPKPVTER